MKVSCPSCGTNYNIDDKRIPPGGAKLKCAKCQSTFPIKRDAAAGNGAGSRSSSSPAVPLPGSATVPSSPAIPLPGAARPSSLGYDMNVATNPAIPLPGSGRAASSATLSAAVPLPGGLATSYDEEATGAAIPLPGLDDASAPAPAEDSGPSPWAGESTRVA